MTIFNADGSLALACGNASRCLSKLIFDNSGHRDITIHVGKRKVVCQYNDNHLASVNMGPVSFEENWMPSKSELWSLAQQYGLEPKEIICVDVANPHLVIFSKISKADQELIGQNFQKSDLFPHGVNVNFAEIEGSYSPPQKLANEEQVQGAYGVENRNLHKVHEDLSTESAKQLPSVVEFPGRSNIKLRVWERGTGFTYACGSGAVASFAAANKFNFVQDEALILFELGNLLMQKQSDNITMTGPASFVFKGDFHYE